MREVRFILDDQAFKQLKANTDQAKMSTIAGEALALFNWALDEVKQGRKIVSMDAAEDDIREIVTPTLQRYRTMQSAAPTPAAAEAAH